MNSNYLVIFIIPLLIFINACDSDNNSSAQESPVTDVTTAECPCFSAKSLEMEFSSNSSANPELACTYGPDNFNFIIEWFDSNNSEFNVQIICFNGAFGSDNCNCNIGSVTDNNPIVVDSLTVPEYLACAIDMREFAGSQGAALELCGLEGIN